MVLGMFLPGQRGDNAVAAVGATTSIVNLLIGFFVGLSIGANVLVSRCVGKRDVDGSRRLVGTSIVVSVLFGIIIMLIGVFCARTFMVWMNCDIDVLDQATLYLQIYFLGMPIIMLYNFSASILRAVGDTFRPFIYLIIGGVVNVGLNIFFITVLNMDVAGVAIATVASQGISALLACIALVKGNGFAKLEKKNFKIYKKELVEIFKIGLPVGIAKCLFSLSNVIIQSAINELGDDVMAAHAIGHQYDAFINEALHAISLAALSFISQNIGAREIKRVKKTIFLSMFLIVVSSVLIGAIILPLAPYLCDLTTDSPEIIKLACERIYIMGGSYVLCGAMATLQETLRGLGKSFLSMLISLFGSCVLRIVYIHTLYPVLGKTHDMIYLIYPVTWFLTSVMFVIAIIPVFNKLKVKFAREKQLKEKLANEGENNG
jgi:putative MATE family efflux protein